MYKSVIVGVDGGPGGRDAAALAGSLAGPEATLTLVYVSTRANRASEDLAFAPEHSLPLLLERELTLCGRPAQLQRLSTPTVGAGLERAAEDHEADLIVVGRSRRHGIARVLGADDVKSVVHQTPCAVAVAPRSCADAAPTFRRIGVAFDGSPESEVAVAHAGLLARECGAELAALDVVNPHFYATPWATSAVVVDDPASEVAAARAEVSVPGLEIEHVYGTLFEELLAFSHGVDLLVCGSRRQGPIRRLALGSTSEYLAGHISVPLIVAPSLDTPRLAQRRGRQPAAPA